MVEKSVGNAPEGLAGLCWRLRRLQRASGVSQSDLAAAVGVSPQTMSEILNGKIRRLPPWPRVRLMVETCRERAADARLLPADLADPEAWSLRYFDLEQDLDAPAHVRAGQGTRVSAVAELLSAKVERPYEEVPVALAQLPPEITGFVGRSNELAVLARQLDPAEDVGAVVVSAVAGLAGVGKTTLAVQAGHAAVGHGWFPGGVLFVNLHGYDEVPVEPERALDALLRALGVPAASIPLSAEERAGLYRSKLAQIVGPVLLIADNASTEAQVKLLIPGTGRHKVLVTSRNTLAALGARLVDVTVLDEEDTLILLDRALRVARPDDERITADRQAALRLAQACGGLPLALQITAALLKTDPVLSVAELADGLALESERLERLRYDDGSGTAAPSVAAAFELSYRRLDDAPARLFRLLPVNPVGVGLSEYGDFLRQAGDQARARMLLNEAIQISGKIDYTYRLGKCHQYLAKLEEQQGDNAGAIASYRTALSYFEQVGAAELKEVPADVVVLETDPEIVRAVRAFTGTTSREEAQTYLQRERSLLFTDSADQLLSALVDQVRQNADPEAEMTRSVHLRARLYELRNARQAILQAAGS